MRKLLALFAVLAAPALAQTPLQETTFWAQEVAVGNLPPIGERLPDTPLVVDLEAKGRTFGTQGGTLRTLVTRSKDVRQMVVYGYARLVGYGPDYELYPDILRDIEVIEDRKYILHLRPGHRWSDGAPFTSGDFRYWWEKVVNNAEITPSGPPEFMIVDDKLGRVTFPDDHTVIFEWDINIRRSAVMGLVGAGGLGLLFFRQMNSFNYGGVTMVILAILLLIVLGEVISHYLRKAVI